MDLLGLHHGSWRYLSGLSNWKATRVFRKHASNANRDLSFLIFPIKKFVLYLHSKSNKVIYVLIKEHFDITDERILTQNWSRASPCKVMFRDTFWWFLLDNCQNLAVCIIRCARALDGARTHNGAHTVFEFSEVQTQSLYEECVTLHNNPFHFFFLHDKNHSFFSFLDFRRNEKLIQNYANVK